MRLSLPFILTIAAVAVEASPIADAQPWCSVKGEPCWKSKRSAEAFIEATHAKIHEARVAEPWCSVKGEPCWKSKREAEAFIAASGPLSARNAEPWGCSITKEQAQKGEICWKNKRAAEALVSSLEAGHLMVRILDLVPDLDAEIDAANTRSS